MGAEKATRYFDNVSPDNFAQIKKAAKKSHGTVKSYKDSLTRDERVVSVTFYTSFPERFAERSRETFDAAVKGLALSPFTGMPELLPFK